MTTKKKKASPIKSEGIVEIENIPEDEPEGEAEPDIFEEFEGLSLDNVRYSIYRKTDTGENAFLCYAEPPISVQAVASRYGGGLYTVQAKSTDGKIRKQKSFSIDKIWDKPEAQKVDSEEQLLNKMKIYKELFSDKTSAGVMETATKTIQLTNELSQKMVIQHFELMKGLQDIPQQSDALTEVLTTVMGMLRGGKILPLPTGQPSKIKKEKTGDGGGQ